MYFNIYGSEPTERDHIHKTWKSYARPQWPTTETAQENSKT